MINGVVFIFLDLPGLVGMWILESALPAIATALSWILNTGIWAGKYCVRNCFGIFSLRRAGRRIQAGCKKLWPRLQANKAFWNAMRNEQNSKAWNYIEKKRNNITEEVAKQNFEKIKASRIKQKDSIREDKEDKLKDIDKKMNELIEKINEAQRKRNNPNLQNQE